MNHRQGSNHSNNTNYHAGRKECFLSYILNAAVTIRYQLRK